MSHTSQRVPSPITRQQHLVNREARKQLACELMFKTEVSRQVARSIALGRALLPLRAIFTPKAAWRSVNKSKYYTAHPEKQARFIPKAINA